MERFALIQFTRKSGKIVKTLEGYGAGMLSLYALQNTSKSRDSIVFSLDTGIVKMYCEGTEGMPTITKPERDLNEVRHIDGYCPGLLEEMRRSSTLKEMRDENN